MHIPILTYHSIDDSGSLLSVSSAAFGEHVARLQAAGYTAVPLSDALGRLAKPESPGERPVAITFDDGYATVYEHALPVLESRGWRATVFVVSGRIGSDNIWPGQAASVAPARLLSWDQLRALNRAGWEVGAHSQTHADLTRLEDGPLAEEVSGAKAALEGGLREEVRAFAYPYGAYDRRVRASVEAVYPAACTTDLGIASDVSDPYTLERIDMWYFSRSPASHLFLTRWMPPYLALRRAGREVRSVLVRGLGRPRVSRSRAV